MFFSVYGLYAYGDKEKSTMANYEKIFFDFKINSISGDVINLNDFKGKPVLVVNTASYCGFTKQYDDMQELWDCLLYTSDAADE